MKTLLLLLISLFFSAQTLLAQQQDDILGSWINPSGEAHILIYKIGNRYFGKINKLINLHDTNLKPKLDDKNPDSSLRSRQVLGIELLKNFEYNGNGIYENGTIYDPKTGKTYSCKMTLNGDELKIRGFIGFSLFGRTEIWKRIK